MINDPFHPEEALEREKETTRSRLFGVVCAVTITALLTCRLRIHQALLQSTHSG